MEVVEILSTAIRALAGGGGVSREGGGKSGEGGEERKGRAPTPSSPRTRLCLPKQSTGSE